MQIITVLTSQVLKKYIVKPFCGHSLFPCPGVHSTSSERDKILQYLTVQIAPHPSSVKPLTQLKFESPSWPQQHIFFNITMLFIQYRSVEC